MKERMSDYLKPEAIRQLNKTGMQNNKEFVKIYTELCLLNEELYSTADMCSQSYKNIVDLTFYEMQRRRRNSDYCGKIDELIKELNTCMRPMCAYYLPEIYAHNKKIETIKSVLEEIKKEFIESGVKNDRLR